MQETSTLTSAAPIGPLPARDRIEALDVIRGFALIGICLMNLDFFNRSVLLVGTGLPPGLTGIDYAAAFFTGFFVTGKFWTMFSLLFGMGFAVMLTRAETAGRGFIKPYLRRILALAIFGALHHIFIWGGDILFSYAVAAVFLVLALYGNWKVFVGGIVLFGCLAAVPALRNHAGPAMTTLALTGLIAIFLRNDTRRFKLPMPALVLYLASIALGIADIVMWVMNAGPQGVRIAMGIGAVLLAVLAWLAKTFQDPASARPLRAGATVWVLAFGSMTIGGAVQLLSAKPPAAVTAQAAQGAAQAAQGAAPAQSAPAPADPTKQAAADKAKADAAKRRAERVERIAHDARVVSTGTYAEGVALRAEQFLQRPGREAGFAMVLVGVFLVGTWFVRSGVMAHTAAHLPLFRKLALYGIPFGVGLGLLGSLAGTSAIPGQDSAGFQFGFGLLLLGNLPASIGYASLVVVMLHSASWMKNIRVLAPFGRMALTNYLMQSAVCAVIFYGWGFGQWGMGRAAQLGVALAICAAQVVLSHLWLQHFRYGPLEWVWRAVTYMKLPAMRIERAAPAGAIPAN